MKRLPKNGIPLLMREYAALERIAANPYESATVLLNTCTLEDSATQIPSELLRTTLLYTTAPGETSTKMPVRLW